MSEKRGPGRPPHDDRLTPAEWRIANAVRHGGRNRDIAERLGVTVDAVKFHIASVTGKLGLPGRAALKQWVGAPRDSAVAEEGGAMSTTGIGQIGQLSRSVMDIGAAEAWYRDVLGLRHLYTFGNLAFFDCGGTRLMLSAEGGLAPAPDGYIIYFRVPDIHAAHRDMAGRGIAFEGAPHMIHRHADGTEEWMAFFRDNEGRALAIMSQATPVRLPNG
jgi:DNA-binding CsgD family transcriptional regulator/catechol 2,3-dioxygenase-like lactoylglutathione lyase family enzyme